MSNNKNSEHKVELSFHTTLRKIKQKYNSQSRSFQTTSNHSNQINMSIDGSSYNCSIQSGQWTMPFKIYYSIARKYSRLGNQKTNLKHNSLSFKGIWNIFLKFQVFQVFLKCHKKQFFPQVFQVSEPCKTDGNSTIFFSCTTLIWKFHFLFIDPWDFYILFFQYS